MSLSKYRVVTADDACTRLAQLSYGAAITLLVCALQLMRAEERPTFPMQWGEAPTIEAGADHRMLPGGYGQGSSAVAKWIEERMKDEGTALAS